MRRVSPLVWFVAAWIVTSPDLSGSDAPTAARIMEGPIIEGQGIGPVRIGMREADLVQQVGVPDQMSTATLGPQAVKIADYAAPPLLLRVFLRGGSVDGILIMVVRLDVPAPPGLDVPGITLGGRLATVRARYGPGTGGRLWYPDRGIAFNPADQNRPDSDRVYAILIVRPGSNDLFEMYGRLVH